MNSPFLQIWFKVSFTPETLLLLLLCTFGRRQLCAAALSRDDDERLVRISSQLGA